MHKKVNLSLKWFFFFFYQTAHIKIRYWLQLAFLCSDAFYWLFFSALWCSTKVIGSVYFPFGITEEILDALQMCVLGLQIFSAHIKWTRNTSFLKGKEESHSDENAFLFCWDIHRSVQRGRKVCLKQAIPWKINMAGHLNAYGFSACMCNALVVRCANVTFIFPLFP